MRHGSHPSSLLSAIAHLLDGSWADQPNDIFVLLLDDPPSPDGLTFALRALPPGRHPCETLHDFVPPTGCWGVGLVVHGRAHMLDALDQPAESIVSTYVRHRDGRQVSLLRRGDSVEELRGPAVGRLPDLCEQILSPGRRTGGGI